MAHEFDLFVIGGGSGGVRAARVAAQHGARVALAEEYRMGGTCVIRGCVPKKLMVYASAFPDQFEDARAFGWDAHSGNFDWPAFRSRLHAELDRLESVYRNLLNGSGVTVFDVRAELADANTIRLADGRTVSAQRILIATGGRPRIPERWSGLPVLTSNDLFLLDELPRSMLVIGGGFIACEFACIFNALGVEVTQYYRGTQILRGFDDEARAHLADAMIAQGIRLHLETDVTDLKEVPGGLRVTDTNAENRDFEKVLMATGRVPNTDALGLERAGVRLGQRGAVTVDEHSQTSVASIHAVGDVTDRLALTPVAIREGHAYADSVFGSKDWTVSHDLVGVAVFTRPELATIGLSEEAASARGAVDIYSTLFRAMQSGFAGRPDKVLMKLVVDAATSRVLGCHIVGDHAAEMIQLAAVAMGMGATKADFDRAIAVHPTMSEELVTMRAPVRRTG